MTEQTYPDPTAELDEPTVPLGEDDIDDFDLDAWIDGAAPTHRSVTVYAKANLVARKDELEEQIRAMESPRVKAVGGEPDNGLRAEWQSIMDQILASKLTVTVQALSTEKIDASMKQYRKIHKIDSAHATSRDPSVFAKFDYPGQERYAAFDAVVAPKFKDREQFERFLDRIGPNQTELVLDAWRKAVKNAAVVVTTDFSPRSSDDDDGRP